MLDLATRPSSILEYAELAAFLDGLRDKRGGFADWKNYFRAACLDPYFLLNFVLSFGKEIHSQTGQPLWLHPSVLQSCRLDEWQIENGGGSEHSGRGLGKSHRRTVALSIRQLLKYKNIAMCLGAFEKSAALKWLNLVMKELETNEELQIGFDDTLWPGTNRDEVQKEAKRHGAVWSVDEGAFEVRRTMNRADPTMTAFRFKDGTRTGSRFDGYFADDVEDDRSVRNPDAIAEAKVGHGAAVNCCTPVVLRRFWVMLTNTWFHKDGLSHQEYQKNKARDPRRAIVVPGEDLSRPGPGPMGGTPNYPHTVDTLAAQFDNTIDKAQYVLQLCCSFQGGMRRRFHRSQWAYDDRPVREVAAQSYAVITVDPSRGLEDPTVALAWLLRPDRNYQMVDAVREWIDPSEDEWGLIFRDFVGKWQRLSARLLHIRIEVIGQATYDVHLRDALSGAKLWVPVGATRTTQMPALGFDQGKHAMIWSTLSGPATRGELVMPLPVAEGGEGILVKMGAKKDGNRPLADFIPWFLENEWEPFPISKEDNTLDSAKLLFMDPAKFKGAHPKERFDLSFPTGGRAGHWSKVDPRSRRRRSWMVA